MPGGGLGGRLIDLAAAEVFDEVGELAIGRAVGERDELVGDARVGVGIAEIEADGDDFELTGAAGVDAENAGAVLALAKSRDGCADRLIGVVAIVGPVIRAVAGVESRTNLSEDGDTGEGFGQLDVERPLGLVGEDDGAGGGTFGDEAGVEVASFHGVEEIHGGGVCGKCEGWGEGQKKECKLGMDGHEMLRAVGAGLAPDPRGRWKSKGRAEAGRETTNHTNYTNEGTEGRMDAERPGLAYPRRAWARVL